MGNDLVLKVTIPHELLGDMVVKGIAHVINDCKIEPFMAIEPEPQVVIVDKYADKGLRFIQEEKEQKRVVKKLIKFVCMDCKEVNWAVIERSENGAYKMRCRACGSEYEFRERELVKAEYVCSGCERSNVYFTPEMEGMNIVVDKCICTNHTRMTYDAEAGIYVSV